MEESKLEEKLDEIIVLLKELNETLSTFVYRWRDRSNDFED